MREMIQNNLQIKGFTLIKDSAKTTVLAKPDCFKDDTEIYFDYLINSEISRPHYYGKAIHLSGDSEYCIATIYQHDDQNDKLIKKFHFKDTEASEKIEQKFKRLLNIYSKV